MNYALIQKTIGMMILVFAAILIIPFSISLSYNDGNTSSFIYSFLIIFLFGSILFFPNRLNSFESNIKITLRNELYNIAKDFDFAELCITSAAEVILDNNINDEINVETSKAEGNKCKVCWKIRKSKCERSGCFLN